MDEFLRTKMLLGQSAFDILNKSTVCVFGIGGVGSYVCESLARSGIGNFILFDNDVVDITNINRQLIATHETIGKFKTDVMKDRILSINPNANVITHNVFYTEENSMEFNVDKCNYIVDAIDTVKSKLTLIKFANDNNIPIISSMGTGNKLNPLEFEVTDIYKTSVCPLARVMRKELKELNIPKLKVIYSKEKPRVQKFAIPTPPDSSRRSTPASVSFVPSVAGLIISSEVIKDLIGDIDNK